MPQLAWSSSFSSSLITILQHTYLVIFADKDFAARKTKDLPLQFKADEHMGAHFLVIEMALE